MQVLFEYLLQLYLHLEIGAVPSFAISITTSLVARDVKNGSIALTLITLSPVTLKSKSAKAVLTPDSLNLE